MNNYKMNTDILDNLNKMNSNILASCQLEWIINNTDSNKKRKIGIIEEKSDGLRIFQKGPDIPEELRNAILNCIMNYRDNLRKSFESITISSEIDFNSKE